MFNPKIILGYNEPNGVRNRCDMNATKQRTLYQGGLVTVLLR